MITKTRTREVFDRSKIGVGDIIEFNKSTGYRGKRYPNVGIVSSVDDDAVMVHQRSFIEDKLETHRGINIEYADEIKVLIRHPLNV